MLRTDNKDFFVIVYKQLFMYRNELAHIFSKIIKKNGYSWSYIKRNQQVCHLTYRVAFSILIYFKYSKRENRIENDNNFQLAHWNVSAKKCAIKLFLVMKLQLKPTL